MHIGKKNPHKSYKMHNHLENKTVILLTTTDERDLGIIISDDLKLARQYAKAANTAYKVLEVLKRAFVSRSLQIWKTLYTTKI